MKHSVSEITLKAGTKGLFIDVPNSEVVDIKVYFRAGFQFGDFSKYEIPHVLEHHLLSATKKHPKNNELRAEISKNGAVRNAYTSPETVMYWVQCAVFDLDRVLGLITESVTTPTFPRAAFETELENVRTELSKNLSDYSRQVSILSFVANYPKLGVDVEERLAQLDTIEHQDVINYYHKTYSARNGGFIVSGAVSKNKLVIETALERLFGELPSGEQKSFLDEPGLGRYEPINITKDIESNYFTISWFSGGGDDAERAALRLLSAALTAGFTSRIYGKARDKGITFHVSSSFDHTKKAASFGFSGFVNSEKFPSLLELIADEASDVAINGITQSELDAARNLVMGGITLGTQTTGSISGWYTGDYIFDGSIVSYDDYFDQLRQVSVDSIKEAAIKLLLSPLHSSAYVGPLTKAELLQYEAVLSPIWLD